MAVSLLKRPTPLPGFRLSLGITVAYLSLMVLAPLGALALRTAQVTWAQLENELTSPRVLAAFRLTLGAALSASIANLLVGLLVAWVLARYRFWGHSLADALVDLPFALPTAVAGIALTAIYAQNGWLGSILEPLGIKVAFSRVGVTLAMIFVGFPFVVRTVQPVIESLDRSNEEAASTLGASRLQTFLRVILPPLVPSLLTGFTLAFARAVGEYGSIVFISGNMPMETEIVPLLIVTKLEQYDYAGAMIIAVMLLVVSLGLLGASNLLQRWSRLRFGGTVND